MGGILCSICCRLGRPADMGSAQKVSGHSCCQACSPVQASAPQQRRDQEAPNMPSLELDASEGLEAEKPQRGLRGDHLWPPHHIAGALNMQQPEGPAGCWQSAQSASAAGRYAQVGGEMHAGGCESGPWQGRGTGSSCGSRRESRTWTWIGTWSSCPTWPCPCTAPTAQPWNQHHFQQRRCSHGSRMLSHRGGHTQGRNSAPIGRAGACSCVSVGCRAVR